MSEVRSSLAGVLVLEPTDVELVVGEEQRLRAFVCPESHVAPEADASCSPAVEVEWSLEDPSAARLVRRGGGSKDERRRPIVVIAETPAATWLIARSGSSEARTRLTVYPATR